MVSPQWSKNEIVYNSVWFIPGVMMLSRFNFEVHQSRRHHTYPLHYKTMLSITLTYVPCNYSIHWQNCFHKIVFLFHINLFNHIILQHITWPLNLRSSLYSSQNIHFSASQCKAVTGGWWLTYRKKQDN